MMRAGGLIRLGKDRESIVRRVSSTLEPATAPRGTGVRGVPDGLGREARTDRLTHLTSGLGAATQAGVPKGNLGTLRARLNHPLRAHDQ